MSHVGIEARGPWRSLSWEGRAGEQCPLEELGSASSRVPQPSCGATPWKDGVPPCRASLVTLRVYLSKITADGDWSHEIRRHSCPGGKALTNLDKSIKKQKHHFAYKGPYSESYSLSSSHVWIWESDHKEGWAPKNWCFGTMVLEKTLESPLDCKEIKPVHPKRIQPWIFIGRTDAEVEAPILWPPGMKSWLTGKRYWCWERLKAKEEESSRG